MSDTNQDKTQEIQELLGQIFHNIGVSSEMSDVSVEIKDPGLYCEIFEIMFPFLQEQI